MEHQSPMKKAAASKAPVKKPPIIGRYGNLPGPGPGRPKGVPNKFNGQGQWSATQVIAIRKRCLEDSTGPLYEADTAGVESSANAQAAISIKSCLPPILTALR